MCASASTTAALTESILPLPPPCLASARDRDQPWAAANCSSAPFRPRPRQEGSSADPTAQAPVPAGADGAVLGEYLTGVVK